MKLFLEIIKERTEEEEEHGYPEQIIRYEVKDEEEAKKILRKLKRVLRIENWKVQVHYCYHKEKRSCAIRLLK